MDRIIPSQLASKTGLHFHSGIFHEYMLANPCECYALRQFYDEREIVVIRTLAEFRSLLNFPFLDLSLMFQVTLEK